MAMFLADSYDSTKYMCQVFYRKEKINHWKATLAFFTIEKQMVEKIAILLIMFACRMSIQFTSLRSLVQLQSFSSSVVPILQSKFVSRSSKQKNGM